MKVENLQELQKQWEKESVQTNGQDWLKKNAKRLHAEWAYLVDGGFIIEESRKGTLRANHHPDSATGFPSLCQLGYLFWFF